MPPDQAPVVDPTDTEPFIATVGLLAHTDTFDPIVTTGGFVNVICKLSIVLGHPFKLPVDISFIFTPPELKSPGDGK